ncbi:hypothetical protein BKA66DRAFT_414521 [Pyrenochaeta sp. MPI-SDFR-AT-0127]|nr:hypothetical protein BKA66DRAFT_414521 [Pyrenochaeta sp. MPI-SDFR-AT-0127]
MWSSHYTTVTAKTLTINHDVEEIFSTGLVKIAFDYPYLLHVLLALGALHLDHLGGHSRAGDLDYLHQAEQHHDAALTDFQANVRDIDDQNYKAVLMFAGTLFPYSCAMSTAANTNLDHAFSSLFSNLLLTRRVRPMVVGVYEAMKRSELGKLIPIELTTIDWTTKESPVETELTQLRKFSEVVHHVYPPDIVDAYGHAIHMLELLFEVANNSQKPPSDTLLKIWMHFVTDRYVELLSEKQPGSLIIFAHYAVILRRSEHYWFLEGVAEQILKVADILVPTEWSKWLDWPKEQIRGERIFHTPD